jgi:hypothetical protein
LEPVNIRPAHGPEWKIQKDFIKFLKERRWHVERMVGNMMQKGIPDIYIAHLKHGQRWVDLKNPTSYDFTRAQIQKWPVWDAKGIGIWIITGDHDYEKLFEPPNWHEYWKPRYDDIPTVDELMDELQFTDDTEPDEEGYYDRDDY